MSTISNTQSSANISSIIGDTLIGKAAAEAAENRQFPLQTASLLALGVASQAFSGVYCVGREGSESRAPIGLYILAEQPPGSAKTSILEDFQDGIFKAVKKINKSRKETLKQISQSERDQKGQLHPDEEEERDRNQILKVPMTDATPEVIDRNLSQTNGWFMLASTEKALINTLIGGAYSDKSSNKDLLLKGFNAEWHASDRISRGGYVGKPHGSLIAVSQPGTIDEVLQKSEGSGLVERFLMIMEDSVIGSRDIFKFENQTYKHLPKYSDRIEKVFSKVDGDMAIENLKVITVPKNAARLVLEQMADVEPELAEGKKYGTTFFRGLWSKMSTQIYKLAAVLHIMDGGDEKKMVSQDNVIMAICIVKSLLMGVVKLSEEKGVCGRSVEEAAVEDYMEKNARGLTGKNIRQIKDNLGRKEVFKQYGSTKGKKIEDAVDALCESGVLEKRVSGKREFYVYRG